MQESAVLEHSLRQLAELEQSLSQVEVDLANLHHLDLGLIESNMDGPDVGLALIYGVLGGIFASNEAIRKFLDSIHTDASSKRPESFLGKLLHHRGDWIDKVEMPDGTFKFVNRLGQETGPFLHRVLFGHDPFSLSGDNPFIVLSKQYGILRGTLQVFRHLVADTFSKQGLPIPFHSFFDHQNSDGKLTNWLIDIAKQTKASTGTRLNSQQVFGELFTIHMQDILSMGLTWGLCTAHIKIRGIEDKVRASQIRIVAYAATFFTQVTVGMAKNGGVPYINWPALSLLLKEIYGFLKLNWGEIKQLERVTEQVVLKNAELERTVFATGASLQTHADGRGYWQELTRGTRNVQSLTDLFDEEE